MMATLPGSVRIDLELDLAGYVVEADATQIQQVIVNLLMNAAEAIPGAGGRVVIRTGLIQQKLPRFSSNAQAVIPAGAYAVLEIRDNGAGMTASLLAKIFDPFFSTKFTGRGLGLSAVLGIVKGHRGDIEVVSQPGIGTSVRVFLPALPAGVQKLPVPAATLLRPAGNQTVLIVDDEGAHEKPGGHGFEIPGVSGVGCGEWIRSGRSHPLDAIDCRRDSRFDDARDDR